MRLWSSTPKPSRWAVSRATWRAATIPSSPAISTRRSAATDATLPFAPIPRRDQSPQERVPPVRVEGGLHARQAKAQFHEGEGDGGAHPDDDRLGAHQAGAGGDLPDEPAEERVDRLHRRQVDQDA